MKLDLLFFGVLAEEAAASSINIEYTGDIKGLKAEVEKKYPSFAKFDYRVSVNKTLVNENLMLKDGDEVAFLPPFAGG